MVRRGESGAGRLLDTGTNGSSAHETGQQPGMETLDQRQGRESQTSLEYQHFLLGSKAVYLVFGLLESLID